MTPAKKSKAKATAKKAGRPYPILVDNMRAANTRSSPRWNGSTGSTTAAGKRIGNIPPTVAEADYYASLEEPSAVAV